MPATVIGNLAKTVRIGMLLLSWPGCRDEGNCRACSRATVWSVKDKTENENGHHWPTGGTHLSGVESRSLSRRIDRMVGAVATDLRFAIDVVNESGHGELMKLSEIWRPNDTGANSGSPIATGKGARSVGINFR